MIIRTLIKIRETIKIEIWGINADERKKLLD